MPPSADRITTMPYALESTGEWERLERQSMLPHYDFTKELRDLVVRSGDLVLDAGCGSGIVTRYLAEQNPGARVVGCDFAAERLEITKEAAAHLPNARFEVQDLASLGFPERSFDAIVCRYVLQHINKDARDKALKEMLRCLKPNGRLHIIDFDGTLYNLYPQPPRVAKVLSRLEAANLVDLRIGRKLPAMLVDAGYVGIQWRIETLQFSGEELEQEVEMMRARLRNARGFLTSFLGSTRKFESFERGFLEALRDPRTVYFYNKFIATGLKQGSQGLALVK